MKKLFLALFLMGSGLAYSQTTMDEYNYITKGFLTMQTQGLGVKAGYATADKGKYTLDYGSYQLTVSILALTRTADNSTAGYILMVHDSKKNNTLYFCCPAKNTDQGVWNNVLGDIRKAYDKDKSGYEAIMYAVMHIVQ